MIAFYDAQGEKHPLQIYEDYSITHEEDGCDSMTFSVPVKHEQYRLLHEECRVEDDRNIWLIKQIDDDRITCKLDFDFLMQNLYIGYKSQTKLLSEVLAAHLPAGWTVEGAGQSVIRRSIEFDFATDYNVVYECMDTYKVRFVWHMKEKRLVVIDPENTPYVGQYLTTELNLKSLSFKGDTTEFVTRLYCVGKDGMTIEDAQVDNGSGGKKRYGLPYIENRQYADKIICASWQDDRYTDPTSMYEDGLEKMKTLAFPVRSYECVVVDLGKLSPEYAFLGIAMHYRMMLMDPDRGVKVEHRVVQYREYPDENDRNTVTLSCVPGTIQGSLKSSIKSLTEQTERKALSAVTEASERLMNLLEESSGLYCTAQKQGDDSTIYYLHDKKELGESTYVIKLTAQAIGFSTDGGKSYPYGFTITGEMVANLLSTHGVNADWINTGTLNLNLLKLQATESGGLIGGLAKGNGNDGNNVTTGIVLYGPNGFDKDGNALPPYIILTNKGFRVQLSESTGFYIVAGSNLVVNTGMRVNGAFYATGEIRGANNVWIGRDLNVSSPHISVFTTDSSGYNLVGYSRTSAAEWLCYEGGTLVIHGSNITSDVTIRATSDREKKKDIEPLVEVETPPAPAASDPGGIEGPGVEEPAPEVDLGTKYERFLEALPPVRFRYKTEAESDPFHLGYIYQDAEAAMAAVGLSRTDLAAVGECLDEKGEVSKGIAYSELVPILHLILLRQGKKITEMEQRIAALEAALVGGTK